ncbi:unnamed protein product, partial [Acanthocheilonema viteae]
FAKMKQIEKGNLTMNNSRSVEDNSNNVGGGWYNTRRQYRSVAFGTWKVGNARDLSVKRGVSEGEGQLARIYFNACI